jgi:hypothetical protein
MPASCLLLKDIFGDYLCELFMGFDEGVDGKKV